MWGGWPSGGVGGRWVVVDDLRCNWVAKDLGALPFFLVSDTVTPLYKRLCQYIGPSVMLELKCVKTTVYEATDVTVCV